MAAAIPSVVSAPNTADRQPNCSFDSEQQGTSAVWLNSLRLLGGATRAILCAVGFAVGLLVLLAPLYTMPAEDAVILFQFSRNLASTGAITYVAQGRHVEGATDFGWMIWIALWTRLGLNPFWVTAITSFVALCSIPVVLLRLAKRDVRFLDIFCLIGCAGLLPPIIAVVLGFSVLPFCFLIALLTFWVLRGADPATALTALALCLLRPDGVVFAVPLLLYRVLWFPGRKRRVALFTGLFAVPGILYFVWRWQYFGELLPLPFLVKSQAERMGHLFVVQTIEQVLLLAIFCAVVIVVALRHLAWSREITVVFWTVLALPTLFYISMRLDQDVARRFFAYLPLGTAMILALCWRTLGSRKLIVLAVTAASYAVLLAPMTYKVIQDTRAMQGENRKSIAEGMGSLPHGLLLTTEAGVLPYYSHWRTLDMWGLNSPEFTRRLIQPVDIRRAEADVVFVHSSEGCVLKSDWHTPYQNRTWSNMTRNTVAGVGDRYELWIVPYGSISWRLQHGYQSWSLAQECWFLRKDGTDRVQMENLLRLHYGLPYVQYLAHTAVQPVAPVKLKVTASRVARIRHWFSTAFWDFASLSNA